jgi:D-serine deaminase-like pyridoxal phosphate-dependent protein
LICGKLLKKLIGILYPCIRLLISIFQSIPMSYLAQITSPTLVLSERITRNNLQRMAIKAKTHGKKLVPHWKTSQSKEVGRWAREYGITEITCSSIKMAEYLSQEGWERIHIAFPFNVRELPKLNQLALQQRMSVQVVNPVTATLLARELRAPIDFFIEIDAGYGRTGVQFSDTATIDSILSIASGCSHLQFRGFYLHPGHTYYGKDNFKIHQESRNALKSLKDRYNILYPKLLTRLGDTPGCAVVEDFGEVDELGPGNFVFFDLMQVALGSCRKEDIALCLAVPVVDIQHSRKEILIHGGGVHLAKDVLVQADGSKNFGEIVLLHDQGWTIPKHYSYVKSISQEHGIIQASEELLASVQVGDLLGILPVHSCMTADCMGFYLGLDGKIIDHAEGARL